MSIFDSTKPAAKDGIRGDASFYCSFSKQDVIDEMIIDPRKCVSSRHHPERQLTVSSMFTLGVAAFVL